MNAMKKEVSNTAAAPSPEERDAFFASVRPALITKEAHPDLASTCPHTPVPGTDLLEVAVVNGTYVTQKEMQRFCCTQGELFSAANKNQQADGYQLSTIYATLGIPSPDSEEVPLYVLTAPKVEFGSAVLLNKEALQNASEAIGGDLLIIPSSIHEVLLVSSSQIEPEELETIVQIVNKEEVRPEDILSDHVYHYDCQTKQLALAVTEHLYENRRTEAHTDPLERRVRR